MSQNSGGSTIGERAKLKMSSICNVARGQCSQRTAYVLCFPMTTISIPSHAQSRSKAFCHPRYRQASTRSARIIELARREIRAGSQAGNLRLCSPSEAACTIAGLSPTQNFQSGTDIVGVPHGRHDTE